MSIFEARWHAVRTLLAATLLTGCAALPSPEPRQYLDSKTGITYVMMDAPLVFARSRKDVAANARDYVTLLAVSRNQSGEVTTRLLAYRWSTVDRRVAPRIDVSERVILIVADGRDMHLVPDRASLFDDTSADAFQRPPVNDVQTLSYPVDAATLSYLATSQSLTLSFDLPEDSVPYELWSDQRSALQRFVETALPH